MSLKYPKQRPTLWNYIELMYCVFLQLYIYIPVRLIHTFTTHIGLSWTVEYWLRNVTNMISKSWMIFFLFTKFFISSYSSHSCGYNACKYVLNEAILTEIFTFYYAIRLSIKTNPFLERWCNAHKCSLQTSQ